MSQNVWGLQVDQIGQRDTLKAYSCQLEETGRIAACKQIETFKISALKQ